MGELQLPSWAVCADPATELVCEQNLPSTPIPVTANTIYYVIVEGPVSTMTGDYTVAIKIIPQ